MASEYFDFKRFRVYHDKCAMKVGTDGVLLGAWAAVEDAGRILDIGTGSGLTALMLAQRSEAEVVAVEIEREAALQAADNAAASPFAGRIRVVNADVRQWAETQEETFDAVVSNPPFFEETLLPPMAARSKARHAQGGGLNFEELTDCAGRVLKTEGTFSVIVPKPAAEAFTTLCRAKGLQPVRQTDVVTKPGKTPKRALMEFLKTSRPNTASINLLHLTDETGARSEEYKALAADFYL